MKKFYFRLSDDNLEQKLVTFYKEHKDAEVKPEVIVFQDFSLESESKGVNLEKRTLRALVSGPKEDRHRETINPKGWDVSIYKKVNPVLLWAHRYDLPPVGKALSLIIKKTGDMIADYEFAKTEFAEQILNLYNDGFLNSFSVGFKVIEWGTRVTEGDPNGYTFNKQELLEVSCVPVPAYAESTVLRDVAGDHIKDETIKTVEEDQTKLDEYMEQFSKHAEENKNEYDPDKFTNKDLADKLDKILQLVENVQEAQKLLASEVDLIKSQTAELGDEKLKAVREQLVLANKATSKALRDSKKFILLKK